MCFKTINAIIAIIWLAGCATFGYDRDYAKPRSYVVTVADEKEGPFLEIQCRYVGKEPEGPFVTEFDWQPKAPDFYHYTIRNLTDKPVTFLTLSSYSKYPSTYTLHGPSQFEDAVLQMDRDRIVFDLQRPPFRQSSILKPNGLLYLKNLFYYGGLPFNIRFHALTLSWQGSDYRFTVYQIYKRSDKN